MTCTPDKNLDSPFQGCRSSHQSNRTSSLMIHNNSDCFLHCFLDMTSYRQKYVVLTDPILVRPQIWQSYPSMTLDTQVTATLRAYNYHLQSLRQLRGSLPRDVAQSVACAIIGSRLDYCNFLYYGMSNNNFQRLQRVQNAAARIVCQAPRRQDHSADLLKDLHWLPVRWQSRLRDRRPLL